ncbi:hypothetical protein PEDI_04910 [Persicobacter diffluens]|uniref:Calx-beta domain-containing protein n=2 Tax=Persicobacter diffluens TaxID=981 RepID=A0AAN4VTS1_9BACT|nr:hypothetical protein PEDI_04910 [Persicobacter diffluens]
MAIALFSCEENIHETKYAGERRVQFDLSQNLVAAEGGDEAVIAVLLDQPLSSDLTVSLDIETINAVEGEDFQLSSGSIVVKAGELSGAISLTAIPDTEISDVDRIVNFSIASVSDPEVVVGFSDGTERTSVSAEIKDKVYKGVTMADDDSGDQWEFVTQVIDNGDGTHTILNAWGEYVYFYTQNPAYIGAFDAVVIISIGDDGAVTVVDQSPYCQVTDITYDVAADKYSIKLLDVDVFNGGPYPYITTLQP